MMCTRYPYLKIVREVSISIDSRTFLKSSIESSYKWKMKFHFYFRNFCNPFDSDTGLHSGEQRGGPCSYHSNKHKNLIL